MKQKIYLATFTLLVASVAGIAYAAQTRGNDALAIESVKISMIQAVTIAEQHVGGKAARAEYEQDKGHWLFEVEIVKGNMVKDVSIDASSGKIIAVVEDHADADDEDEKKD